MTFAVAAYAQARERLRKLGRSSLGLSCSDERTRAFVEGAMASLKRSGAYPNPTGRPDALNYHLYNLHPPLFSWGSRGVAVCNFRWQFCPTGDVGGHFVLVDALALHDDEEYARTALPALSTPLEAGGRSPVAFVFTKCDLLPPTGTVRTRLRERLAPLLDVVAAAGLAHATFFSAVSVGTIPGTSSRVLLSSGAASALIWLYHQMHPLNRPPLRVKVDELLSAG
jgi:hypothetical protein